MKKLDKQFGALLHEQGHKATPGRIAIIKLLDKNKRPLSAPQIYKELKNSVDQVTVYRTLDALAESGIVRKVNFQHPHAHYEILLGHGHHHHIICKSCGKVEDIKIHNTEIFEKNALKKSKSFASIKDHSLEFFGICNTCIKTRKP